MSIEVVLTIAGIILVVYGIIGRKLKGVATTNYQFFTEPLDLWQRLVLTVMGGLFLIIALRPLLGTSQFQTATTPTIIALPSPTLQSATETDCILEDFENGLQLTWWSPDPTVFSYNPVSEQAYHGDEALKVSYQKTNTYQYIGAEIPAGLCDFTKSSTLHVWVYGEVTLLLKLEDQNLKQVDISEERVLDSAAWTELTFDYSSAANLIDLSRIKSLFFFPAPGDSKADGVFYLDRIALSP